MYLANVDVGECSFECPYCQAQLWYEERSNKCKRLKQVDFSLCSQKGKVQLPLLKNLHNCFKSCSKVKTLQANILTFSGGS